jgi:hypothetical protein
MLKFDLTATFGRADSELLTTALTHKGLHDHFIILIYKYMSTTTFSITINGQSFGRYRKSQVIYDDSLLSLCIFLIAVGIQQGCSLSTYLFSLELIGLSIISQFYPPDSASDCSRL